MGFGTRALAEYSRFAVSLPVVESMVESGNFAEFCRLWKIVELSVFGSAVRGELRPDSDLDLLVTFAPDADWSLLDHVVIEEQLSALLGRKVDLISRRAVEESQNWIRRRAILGSAHPYYVAR